MSQPSSAHHPSPRPHAQQQQQQQRQPSSTSSTTTNAEQRAHTVNHNPANLVQQPSLFDASSQRSTPPTNNSTTPDRPPLNTLHQPTNSSSLPSLSRVSYSTRGSPSTNGAPSSRTQPGVLNTSHPLSQPLTFLDDKTPQTAIAEHPFTPQTSSRDPKGAGANATPLSSTAPRRAFTSPALTTAKAGASAYSVPSNSNSMDPSAKNPARPDAVPRNSSMDSAMSSVSSATSAAPSILSHSTNHSYHSSSETTVTSSSPPDAASLVTQAAGNHVQVIEKLLKENKHLSSRSDQLWSIVEKQRSMLHGLHADLEKALKDKERYRRRLKEYQQESVPAIPRNPALANEVRDAQRNRDLQNSAHGKGMSLDSMVSGSNGPTSPKSPRHKPHQVLPSQDSQMSIMTESSQSSDYFGQFPTGPDPTEPARSMQPTSPRQRESQQQQSSPATPKATQPKTVSSPGEKARKAAPAPLNLTQSTHSPASTNALNTQASASDYGDFDDEDGAERIESPQFDRGRRRTREQDDREREMIAIAEEARSRSEKSSKSKSKTKSPEETKGDPLPSPKLKSPVKEAPTAGMGLPSSPRAALPPGHTTTAVQPPTDSIASILAPTEPSNAPPEVGQSVTLPPKSPGLPMSPKPSNRMANAPMPRAPVNGLASPGPLSPRQGLPLSPRAPKYPIPMPGTAPTASLTSTLRQEPDLSNAPSMAERLQSAEQATSPQSGPNEVYRGFVSEQFPGLLLTPNALPLVIVKVWSSRLRPATSSLMSKSGDDDGVFTLGVHLRSNGKQLWRVEKKPSTLSAIDHALRKYVKLSVSHPDRSIFHGHAPAKVDARRAALNRYFEAMLDTRMDDKTALIVCDYFSKDTIPPEARADLTSIPDEPTSPTSPRMKARKEGYLAKKGKQFGGWKSRFFVLDNAELRHYESPGGQALGIIKLQQAQIARPNAKDVDEDDEFRHAFMILEPKRRDSSTLMRHVLCAESDDERDRWVEALMSHISGPQPVAPLDSPPSSPRLAQGSFSKTSASFESKRKQRGQESIDDSKTRELQAIHYNDTVPMDAPKLGTPTSAPIAPTPSPLPDDASTSSASTTQQHPTISGPVAGGPIQNASSWGNKAPSPTRAKDRELKKRSMFGFMRTDRDEPHSAHGKRGLSPNPPTNADRASPARAIFGAPLAEAAEYSQPTGINICIPSPVYRCIEYLEANNAHKEQGIFRLSGSQTVVNGLKERFDTERDVNLLKGPYVDIHAVASLLKLYLRMLPDTVLTRDKIVDFQKVLGTIPLKEGGPPVLLLTDPDIEVEEKKRRLAAINLLIHQLPEANREVLVALSGYLIKVVSNSDKTQMPLKNIGIVFAPTLNIPNPLIYTFITDYDSVFTAAPADPDAASPVLEHIATFKAEHPEAVEPSLAENVAAAAATSHNAAGLGGSNGSMSSVQQRIQELSQHSPKTSQNSFTEHLAGQRQQLRQVSKQPRDGSPSSGPPSARSAAYASSQMPRRPRGSPSPGSRAYQTPTPSSRTTPPPRDGSDSRPANGAFMPGSSADSSPSSFASSTMRGRDSPAVSGNAYAANNASAGVSRKARRESAMMGSGFNLNAEPPDAAKRKSSYNRLRENAAADSLREE